MLNQQVHAICRPLVQMRHRRRSRSPRASEHNRVRTDFHFRRQILRESNGRKFLGQIVHWHAKTKYWGLSSDIAILELRSRRHGLPPHGIQIGFQRRTHLAIVITQTSLQMLGEQKSETCSQQRQQSQGIHDNRRKNNAERDGVCMRDQAPTERRVLSEKLHGIKIVANVQNVGHMPNKGKESPKTKVMVRERVFDNTFTKLRMEEVAWATKAPRYHHVCMLPNGRVVSNHHK